MTWATIPKVETSTIADKTNMDNFTKRFYEKGNDNNKKSGMGSGKNYPIHKKSKTKALDKMKGKKKSYTGHYQEDSSGKIRHQSPSQVERKRLNDY